MSLKENRAFIGLLLVNFAMYVACTFMPTITEKMALMSSDFHGVSGVFLGLLHLLTYQFAHADFGHFFGNFMFAAPLALYLEPRLGSSRFLSLYLVSGVGSALLFMFAPHLSGWNGLIGASGAISGIAFGALLEFARNSNKMVTAIMAVVLAVLFHEQLVPAVLSSIMPLGIAYWGHCDGQLTALLFDAIYPRK